MERLTTKIPKPVYYLTLMKCYFKLQELEDIEEALGIDLITLFKALTNGFYAITDTDKNTIGYVRGGEFYLRLGIETKRIYAVGNNEDYYFSDYGKLWALRKEDLK